MASSRLCVRGLPKHIGEEELRNHFLGKWTITDVKVARTRDGKSRQFGFVGFLKVEDAEAAKKYFDKSYLGATKLTIEFARQKNNLDNSRPWSKYSKGSSAYDKLNKVSKEPERVEPKNEEKRERAKDRQPKGQEPPDEGDPQLKEFLELMQPRSKTQTWGNAEAIAKGSTGPTAPETTGGSPLAGKGLPGEEGGEGEVEDEENEEGPGGAMSDMDYLRSKMRNDFEDLDEDDGLEEIHSAASSSELEEIFSEDEVDGSSLPEESLDIQGTDEKLASPTGRGERMLEAPEEVVSRTKRLFVRNLTYTVTEKDLISLFQDFGDIVDVNLAMDNRTGRSKGYALIHFSEAEAAVQALKEMDREIYQGRLMHVLPGEASKETAAASDAQGKNKERSGFQAEKEAKQAANVGNRAAWNTLFMRPDTVTEAIASHYGISRSELMDRDASDLGVRMALGETQVIAKTKEALKETGVNVEKMEQAALASGKASDSVAVSRSSTTLLVKNLPYKCERDELIGMFGDFGQLTRVIVPPTKVLALVEYQESRQAQKAFRCLAYRKYHGVPIYLEWAPRGIFFSQAEEVIQKAPESEQEEENNMHQMIEMQREGPSSMPVEVDESDEETTLQSCTVYVKNLSFTTTETGLRNHLDSCVSEVGGRLHSVVVATKLRNDGKRVSAGFGFVEVDSDRVVKYLIKKQQGTLLDGHKIMLQRSMRKTAKTQIGTENSRRKRSRDEIKSTKLLVRNLAFESTKKDLMGLFGPFGHIKTCRIPKKFDGTHRGFAFVDFVTNQEAESAKDGVMGAHLYGRRLVIEYAKEEDGGLDALREKTAKKFNAG